MNVLSLLGQLGHALVSWGLGGPGELPAPETVLACPVVEFRAPLQVAVPVAGAAHVTVGTGAPTHVVIAVEGSC